LRRLPWPGALALALTCACSAPRRPTPAEDPVLALAELARQRYAGHSGLGNPQVQRIAADVYAVMDLYNPAGGVNAGIVFSNNSVVFIDAGTSVVSGQFLWDIASARMRGDEAVYLVLTHHHSDHTFGMRVFREKGATVIAHALADMWLGDDNGRYKATLTAMMRWTPEKADSILRDVILTAPDRTILADTVLNLDSDEVQLLVTPGHVPSELAVYHQRSGTLFASDALYEGMPPTTRFGEPPQWESWIGELRRLRDLEPTTIVPGHGKLCSVAEIDRNIDYLTELLAAQRPGS
jgi:cyclase